MDSTTAQVQLNCGNHLAGVAQMPCRTLLGRVLYLPETTLGWGNREEFIEKAIENNMMVIPGSIFSDHDTRFRISRAASDAMIERGIETLCRLAEMK